MPNDDRTEQAVRETEPTLSRRAFLRAASAGGIDLALTGRAGKPPTKQPPHLPVAGSGWDCDVLIVGGSLGGVAAALRAAALGVSVRLLEESDWIGGQLTYQGVSTPDENHWTTPVGSTLAYQQFCAGVRRYYKSRYKLSRKGERMHPFNPGDCWASRLSMEPRVALTVLMEMVRAYPNLTLMLNYRAVGVEVSGDTITRVHVVGPKGKPSSLRAPIVLDATDLGDLLPIADVEHVIGAESREETGEPDAPGEAHPEWIQSITFPFALERRPEGEKHTIPRPPDYEALKKLQKYGLRDGGIRGMFGPFSLWTYRRIIDADAFDDPRIRADITIVNTASNDYRGGIIPTHSPEADARTLAGARKASLGYLYWLQTECPRHNDPTRRGYPELKLRKDVFGTPDGLSQRPYIRESRRIKALTTIREQDIVRHDRAGNPCQMGPRAAFCPDSCGIGYYLLDVHASPTHRPGIFLATRPFQIPFGALIPIRMTNLLAASKNLGTTHITNGAYRLQPIEWNIGEAAGALAAFCIRHRIRPRDVYDDAGRRLAYQHTLLDAGVPLYWWTDLPPTHPAFKAAQLVAMRRIWPEPRTLAFRPEAHLSTADLRQIETSIGRPLTTISATMTHAEAAIQLLNLHS